MRLVDLARSIAPECRHDIVGIRPGEKLHEVLVTEDEARRTLEFNDFFVVQPGAIMSWWENGHLNRGRPVAPEFNYKSDTNTWWLSVEELRHLIGQDETKSHPLRAAMG